MDTSFITLSISNLVIADPSPGDYDPCIPCLLAILNIAAAENEPQGSQARPAHIIAAQRWYQIGDGMKRGERQPWWSRAIPDLQFATSNEMAYECDSNLGNPAPVNCMHIEWDQLGSTGSSPSDILTIAPGTVEFFHSDTCYLAISASVPMTLTWEQIRTAAKTLLSICVTGPLQAATPQGGKAYYKQPQKGLSGREEKERRSINGRSGGPPLTPLNALAPHTNLTLFQQTERWTSPIGELDSCTWKAIVEGTPVSCCSKL